MRGLLSGGGNCAVGPAPGNHLLGSASSSAIPSPPAPVPGECRPSPSSPTTSSAPCSGAASPTPDRYLTDACRSSRLWLGLYAAGATRARICFSGSPGLPQATVTSVPISEWATSIGQSESIWRYEYE